MKIRRFNKDFWKNIKSELSMAIFYMKGNILSAAELRFTFISQVVGMIVNDISLLLVWVFFFQTFGSINGWSGYEIFALQGFLAITYGLAFSFCSGVLQLPSVINNGSFDSLLLTPRSIYMRILTLTTQAQSIGDILYGVIVLLIYFYIANLTLPQIFVSLLLIIPAVSILINFALITSSLNFFIPDSAELSRHFFEFLLGPSLYPAGVFQGVMRLIFIFLVPALVVGGFPVETFKDLNILNILLIWAIAIFWFFVARFVLQKGIQHYESGNLTGARI